MKSWSDEDFALPEGVKKGIELGLRFERPTKIQAFAIPMICQAPYGNLIAESKNGSGKTGAFVVGSVLRVDPTIKGTQVIVVCNAKVMVTQIAGIYKSLCEHAGISVIDTTEEAGTDAHIVVCTVGKMKALQSGKKRIKFDKLKVLVFDEADVYFSDAETVD